MVDEIKQKLDEVDSEKAELELRVQDLLEEEARVKLFKEEVMYDIHC